LISKAVQTELAEFLSQYQDIQDSEGRPLVVRNGYLPEREIMTGIGDDVVLSKIVKDVVMFYRMELERGKG
jgi:putative transposase